VGPPYQSASGGDSRGSFLWNMTITSTTRSKHPYCKNLTRRSIRDCHNLEQAGLSTNTLAVFSNQWAADVARASYSFDERKLRVIPYGANLFTTPDAGDIAQFLSRRYARKCELLFVGLNWECKEAQIAIEATSVLRKRGIDARLTLVGCLPPRGFSLPEYVTITGKIDKTTQEGQDVLTALYAQSHFLILPTRADCAAISLAEASAHGVPSLSTNVGGNSTLVKNGVNGHLFPLEAEPAEYALQLLGNSGLYSAMCWSSFKRFQAELNWDVAVSRLMTEINTVLQPVGGQYECSPAS
jgi:glycosyltransferase involved in cell wall biosynthesis